MIDLILKNRTVLCSWVRQADKSLERQFFSSTLPIELSFPRHQFYLPKYPYPSVQSGRENWTRFRNWWLKIKVRSTVLFVNRDCSATWHQLDHSCSAMWACNCICNEIGIASAINYCWKAGIIKIKFDGVLLQQNFQPIKATFIFVASTGAGWLA